METLKESDQIANEQDILFTLRNLTPEAVKKIINKIENEGVSLGCVPKPGEPHVYHPTPAPTRPQNPLEPK